MIRLGSPGTPCPLTSGPERGSLGPCPVPVLSAPSVAALEGGPVRRGSPVTCALPIFGTPEKGAPGADGPAVPVPGNPGAVACGGGPAPGAPVLGPMPGT